jgi:phosphoribosylformylglycinamidine synthase
MNMGFGNEIGFAADPGSVTDWFTAMPGAIVAELSEDFTGARRIGFTIREPEIRLETDCVSLAELLKLNEGVLESVYPMSAEEASEPVPCFTYSAQKHAAPFVKYARPKAVIPVFPGTNCEYDTARAWMEAGGEAEILVVRNLTADDVAYSVARFSKALKTAQTVLIPGGFSGGDEPDGSAKFITAFFRNPSVKEEVEALLRDRDGLMLGICNGFQALIKLGLVPYGEIVETKDTDPTLTFNTIGRHISQMAYTRITSVKSPWFSSVNAGDVFAIPISHGEGRFVANDDVMKKLIENGQVATQYVDINGEVTDAMPFNPNGSVCAVEGITSPDGRVLGKMGHSERKGSELYSNVPFEKDMKIFESGVKYFK